MIFNKVSVGKYVIVVVDGRHNVMCRVVVAEYLSLLPNHRVPVSLFNATYSGKCSP